MFTSGFQDGKTSASLKNPIHNNWKRDKSGKLTHFNKVYLAAYVEGWRQNSGIVPVCFPNK